MVASQFIGSFYGVINNVRAFRYATSSVYFSYVAYLRHALVWRDVLSQPMNWLASPLWYLRHHYVCISSLAFLRRHFVCIFFLVSATSFWFASLLWYLRLFCLQPFSSAYDIIVSMSLQISPNAIRGKRCSLRGRFPRMAVFVLFLRFCLFRLISGEACLLGR